MCQAPCRKWPAGEHVPPWRRLSGRGRRVEEAVYALDALRVGDDHVEADVLGLAVRAGLPLEAALGMMRVDRPGEPEDVSGETLLCGSDEGVELLCAAQLDVGVDVGRITACRAAPGAHAGAPRRVSLKVAM